MNCTEERFLKNVKDHQILVIRDDGVNRHIRFRKPNSSNMYFDLITWPGYLCFTGDMGTYVFQRLEDMFQFFRADREYYARRHGQQRLFINQSYWSEKLKAVDVSGSCSGSATEFSPERFKQVINEYRVRWIRDARSYNSMTKEKRRELWEAVQEEVLDYLDDGEQAVYARASEFHWTAGRFLPGDYPSYAFEELWDHRFTDYTFHFTWCCYALAWGIQKYDESKT